MGFSLLMLWKVQSYYCSIISNSLIESKWKGRSDTSSMLWRKCAWLKRIKSLLYIKFLSGYWDNFPVLFIVHNCYFASSFSHNFNFSHRLVFTFYFLHQFFLHLEEKLNEIELELNKIYTVDVLWMVKKNAEEKSGTMQENCIRNAAFAHHRRVMASRMHK